MEILAAVSDSPDSPFALESVELAELRADEVLVRVQATGVCHTDLTFKGRVPGAAVFGHEGAGVVESVGAAVAGIVVGDHVVLSFRSCGQCRHCTAHLPSYCTKGALLNMSGARSDGTPTLRRSGTGLFGAFFGQSSFAEYAIATRDNVVVVDPEVDPTVAAPLGCGFQTGAGAVLNTLAPDKNSRLAVFGAGSVGLAAVLAAKAVGVEDVVVVDPVATRRQIALDLGASAALEPGQALPHPPTQALDTTGRPDVCAAALEALATRGTLAVVGLGPAEATIDIQDLMLRGKVIRGCMEGDAEPHITIPALLELHAAGRFPIEKLVTTYPAADIERAVADTRSGATVKPVLVW